MSITGVPVGIKLFFRCIFWPSRCPWIQGMPVFFFLRKHLKIWLRRANIMSYLTSKVYFTLKLSNYKATAQSTRLFRTKAQMFTPFWRDVSWNCHLTSKVYFTLKLSNYKATAQITSFPHESPNVHAVLERCILKFCTLCSTSPGRPVDKACVFSPGIWVP